MIYNWHHVLAGETNRARFVERYGSFPHIHQENVAEHSFYVALYSLMLWHETDGIAELGIVLSRALMHDIEESVTGDMLRAVKYSSKEMKKSMDDAGSRLLRTLLQHMMANAGDSREDYANAHMHESWAFAKNDTNEGAIVATADLLCVVSYAHIESQFGNRHARRIRMEVADNLNKLKEKLSTDRTEYVRASDIVKRRLCMVIDDVLATLLMEYPHEGNPR